MQTYSVDMNNCGPMVLDALIKVRGCNMLSHAHTLALFHELAKALPAALHDCESSASMFQSSSSRCWPKPEDGAPARRDVIATTAGRGWCLQPRAWVSSVFASLTSNFPGASTLRLATFPSFTSIE